MSSVLRHWPGQDMRVVITRVSCALNTNTITTTLDVSRYTRHMHHVTVVTCSRSPGRAAKVSVPVLGLEVWCFVSDQALDRLQDEGGTNSQKATAVGNQTQGESTICFSTGNISLADGFKHNIRHTSYATMQAYGESTRVPCLDTRWTSGRLGVPAALNPLDRWRGGPQSQVWTLRRRQKCITPVGKRLRSLARSAHSLRVVTIPSELYQISPSYIRQNE
jgi:hypothetical protein